MNGVPSSLPLLPMHRANAEKHDGSLAVSIPILWFLTAMDIRYGILSLIQPLIYTMHRLILSLATTSGPPSMFSSIRKLQMSSLRGCEARLSFLLCYEKLSSTLRVLHSLSFGLFSHGGQLTIKHTNAYSNFKEHCKC
jgi:hypothetical protein